jgi:NADH-quinone oxidoreductase subunit A
MLIDYLPIVLLFIIAGGFAVTNLAISYLVGPKKPNPVKLSPYESGVPSFGDARLRFSVKFYLVAMLFIIFDIEVVFLYPWAVVFRDLLAQGPFIFYEMVVFLGVLGLGLAYVWRKGGLEWD